MNTLLDFLKFIASFASLILIFIGIMLIILP